MARKTVFSIYISETENSKYWLGVLNELKNRGVKDILICSTDGLNGFSQAIAAVFPKTDIQKCIVHQLRNSLRFVSYKDRKEVALDLKKVYQAPSEEAALLELEHFESEWNAKYPYISKSWRSNWDELSTFFKYPEEIRSLIYTTNPIESFNSSIRRVTKNKTCFPTQDSLLKIAYLAVENILKKWTMPIKNWPTILA